MISQDKKLLKRMRSGDGEALRQIYEKYRDDLFTVAVSLLHDVHTSEDCLQDVFVSLADSADRFNVRNNLKSYLISCVANRARDRMRRKVFQTDCPLEQSSCLAITEGSADKVISREETSKALNALSKLPYEQREVFILRVQGGLKFRQIAKLQDVSTKTVQSRYRYTLEKLRAVLEKGERS